MSDVSQMSVILSSVTDYLAKTLDALDGAQRSGSAVLLPGVRSSALFGAPYFVIQEFYLTNNADQSLSIFGQ